MDTGQGRALIRLYPLYGYWPGPITHKAIPSVWILTGQDTDKAIPSVWILGRAGTDKAIPSVWILDRAGY